MASRLILALLLAALLAGCRRHTVGGIPFRKIAHGRNDTRRYLHVHGSEATARDVLVEHMKTFRGTAFLVKSEKRMVPVGALQIDPNRMFSETGARQNLRRFNPQGAEASIYNALGYLERDRHKFLNKILPQPGGLLIVLHNNTQGYSVEDELEGSDARSLPDAAHPHEFMLTTQWRDFDLLKTSPFNVVLQTQAEPDDGSLSRRCARMNVRYVNIEAGLGQFARQKEMINWIEQNLP